MQQKGYNFVVISKNFFKFSYTSKVYFIKNAKNGMIKYINLLITEIKGRKYE